MKKWDVRGFRIGNAEIPHGLVLAPMAGVTDSAFRAVCRENGAEYTVSEMVSAKALCYEQLCKKKNAKEVSRTAPLAAVRAEENPMAVQIFGSEPQYMANAASLIESGEYFGSVSTASPCAIDINMGCPVPKVVSNGEGCALMKDIFLAEKIVRAVADAVRIPVTVKIRAGWDEKSINAPELARAAEAGGAAAVCVHARTRAQMYAPGIDLSVIYNVKKAVKIPVIGNGDIYSASDARRMTEETGCDGVAVGRGALGNPWIFGELLAAAKGEAFEYPGIRERLETALRQAEAMAAQKGEDVAVREARKHLSWYTKGICGAAEARARINCALSLDEMRKIAKELVEKSSED